MHFMTNKNNLIFKLLPPFTHSYLSLVRLDKPIGFLLLMWPVAWAFIISAEGYPNIFYMTIFAVGIIATRSAGCIINDYFDQDFDSKVERTKRRLMRTGLRVKKDLFSDVSLSK